MSLPDDVRRIVSLEVEFLEGDAAVNGPRGWGEASVHSALVTRHDPETIEITFSGNPNLYRISRKALAAVMRLRA